MYVQYRGHSNQLRGGQGENDRESYSYTQKVALFRTPQRKEFISAQNFQIFGSQRSLSKQTCDDGHYFPQE